MIVSKGGRDKQVPTSLRTKTTYMLQRLLSYIYLIKCYQKLIHVITLLNKNLGTVV